jgi:hypothetical protein
MLEIPYESELFAKSSPVQNGVNNLPVTWDDLLWAAITVGRPGWHFVLRHGQSSLFEALFRASALRLAVEQISPGSKRLRRTAATKHLDPSEKGAVSYFLGMTLCKLFAERKLAAPWMLHLDMFRNQLNPRVLAGRSRPDLVGVTIGGQWVAMESKGRVSPPVADTKNKAKKQAERLVAVNGTPVTYRIGAITYFKDECLRYFWRDPQPDGKEPENAIKLQVPEDQLWRNYYFPILKMVRAIGVENTQGGKIVFSNSGGDFQVHVATQLMALLHSEKWKDAGEWCREHQEHLFKSELRIDGLAVVAGNSWSKPFSESFD